MALPFNVPFSEAVAWFARKISLTRDEFDRLEAWAKARAFTVARVGRAYVIQDIRDAVAHAIENGETLAEFQEQLSGIMERRGWAGTRPWHVETIFRTNVQSAFGAGRYEQQMAVSDEFPFLLYDALNDSRTRASHRALDGVVLPANDPFWRRHYPPWDFNCRCSTESLTTEEARERGISPVNILDIPEQPEGFVSPAFSDTYSPDLRGMDGDLAAAVLRRE